MGGGRRRLFFFECCGIAAEAPLCNGGENRCSLNVGKNALPIPAKRKGGYGRFPDQASVAVFASSLTGLETFIAVLEVRCRVFALLTAIFFSAINLASSRFPMSRLIVHPRLKTDLYRGDVRLEVLDKVLSALPMPLGYNGDLITPEDIEKTAVHYAVAPGGLAEIMVGRALMADPALFRKVNGGRAASLSEILSFGINVLCRWTLSNFLIGSVRTS